jgi:hypothetical protein
MTAYVAAFLIVAAVALFVAAPLSEGFMRRKRSADLEMMRLEHDRQLALQGLRELEFDNEMGKLEPNDYVALKTNLENRAITAMRALEQAVRPRLVLATPSLRTAPANPGTRRVNFCPQCGSRAGRGYRFCPLCGTALNEMPESRAQAQ